MTSSHVNVANRPSAKVNGVMFFPTPRQLTKFRVRTEALMRSFNTFRRASMTKGHFTFSTSTFTIFRVHSGTKGVYKHYRVVSRVILRANRDVTVTCFFINNSILIRSLPSSILGVYNFFIKVIVFRQFQRPTMYRVITRNLQCQGFQFI